MKNGTFLKHIFAIAGQVRQITSLMKAQESAYRLILEAFN